jgi:FtsH-binding integral membrane protein
LIATAFLGTTVVFATFSAAALFSPRRSLLYLGGVITALLATMTILMLVNLFLWSQVVSDVRLYLGIFAFSLFVCFDTQMIVEKAEAGDHDVPSHALELFLDFVNLFVRLLRALQKKSEKKKSKD